MLRTLYFLVRFWLHQMLIYPHQRMLRSRLDADSRGRALRLPAWKVAHRWGNLVIRWAGVKVDRVGMKELPQNEALLIVSNHQGAFDIPILLAGLNIPLGFVAKQELGGIPMISWWMRLSGCIFLDRENHRVQIQQIREIVDNLKEGHSMVIFPEGTRSGEAKMGEFSKGSVNIALKASVPILPVSLKESYRLMGTDKRIRGGEVRLTVHELIDPSILNKEEQAELHTRVRDQIASAI